MYRELRLVGSYFGLVIALTIPIWVFGMATLAEILPRLPIGAISVVCPTLAATIVGWRLGGPSGVRTLLARGLDFQTAGWNLLAVALVNPGLFSVAFVASRLSGSDVPLPDIALLHALMLFALFLPTAIFEEIGWTGFALPHLLAICRPPVAALVIGSVWAVWHYPNLLRTERPLDWIAWWTLWTVSARVIMVWFYDRTRRSVFAAALYHAMSNLCWQLYPVNGSHFDPRISGLVTFGVAMAATFWPATASAADVRRDTP